MSQLLEQPPKSPKSQNIFQELFQLLGDLNQAIDKYNKLPRSAFDVEVLSK